MKHIETNFLIYDLAKNYKPKAQCSVFRFFFIICSLSFLYVASFLLKQDLRQDLITVMSQGLFSLFYLQLAVFVVNAVLGCYVCYSLCMPGLVNKLSYKVISFVFYWLWLSLLVVMLIGTYNEFKTGTAIFVDYNCINTALLSLILPLTVIFYFVKKGFILQKFKTIVAVCLTAQGFASLINLFICPIDDISHILFSHNLIILPIIVLFIILCKLKNK